MKFSGRCFAPSFTIGSPYYNSVLPIEKHAGSVVSLLFVHFGIVQIVYIKANSKDKGKKKKNKEKGKGKGKVLI